MPQDKMFRFEDPQYLYLLSLPLLWAAVYLLSLAGRKRKLKHFGDLDLLADLMPDVSVKRQHYKAALVLSAAAALIVSLARPQMGMTVDNTKKQGIEIIVALDISNSMMAEDIAPNRLECAKQLISSAVGRMDNDKVGIIVFAGDAFSQLPITSDNVSVNMFLDAISPSLITRQGTDIAKAMDLASKSFTQAEGVGRAIIMITDGENHEGRAEEAATDAAKKGINIFMIGVGKETGAPIPYPSARGGYLTDSGGETVITHLNKDMCVRIAEAGKGRFIYLSSIPAARESLFSSLDKIKKTEMQDIVYSSYDEQFQWTALIALILLALDSLTMERKNRLFKRINLFKK